MDKFEKISAVRTETPGTDAWYLCQGLTVNRWMCRQLPEYSIGQDHIRIDTAKPGNFPSPRPKRLEAHLSHVIVMHRWRVSRQIWQLRVPKQLEQLRAKTPHLTSAQTSIEQFLPRMRPDMH